MRLIDSGLPRYIILRQSIRYLHAYHHELFAPRGSQRASEERLCECRCSFDAVDTQIYSRTATPGTKEFSHVAYQHPMSDRVWFGGVIVDDPIQAGQTWQYSIESGVGPAARALSWSLLRSQC